MSDREGFGQIWKVDIETGERTRLTFDEQDFGQPAWVQDLRTFSLIDHDSRALAIVNRRGFMALCLVDLSDGSLSQLESLQDYGDFSHLSISPNQSQAGVIASGPRLASALVTWKFSQWLTTITCRCIRDSGSELSQCGRVHYVSNRRGRHCSWFGLSAGAWNRNHGKWSPLLVIVHGGPTSQETARYNVQAQYFATRGYCVFFPNHRGSSGYGRAYMDALQGQWGVVDVEDVVAGVRYLTQSGRVDGSRCAVMGGSAGGYTVLQSMIQQPDIFCAGVSLYGVTDLFGLLADTHKFEAHYPDGLVGVLLKIEKSLKNARLFFMPTIFSDPWRSSKERRTALFPWLRPRVLFKHCGKMVFSISTGCMKAKVMVFVKVKQLQTFTRP